MHYSLRTTAVLHLYHAVLDLFLAVLDLFLAVLAVVVSLISLLPPKRFWLSPNRSAKLPSLCQPITTTFSHLSLSGHVFVGIKMFFLPLSGKPRCRAPGRDSAAVHCLSCPSPQHRVRSGGARRRHSVRRTISLPTARSVYTVHRRACLRWRPSLHVSGG